MQTFPIPDRFAAFADSLTQQRRARTTQRKAAGLARAAMRPAELAILAERRKQFEDAARTIMEWCACLRTNRLARRISETLPMRPHQPTWLTFAGVEVVRIIHDDTAHLLAGRFRVNINANCQQVLWYDETVDGARTSFFNGFYAHDWPRLMNDLPPAFLAVIADCIVDGSVWAEFTQHLQSEFDQSAFDA